MLNLQQRINILFDNKQDQTDLPLQPFGTVRNAVSGQLKLLIAESAALGMDGMEDGDIKLSSLHKELGISRTFDMLQINKPIVVRLEVTPIGGDEYRLRMGLWLTDRQASYTVEHHVVDFVVENIQEQRIYKRVERMLGELHRFAAPVIAG